MARQRHRASRTQRACAFIVAFASVARGATVSAAHARVDDDASAHFELEDVDARSTLRAGEDVATLASNERELMERVTMPSFESYVEEFGKKAEYCGSEERFPCAESARREATYDENMRAVQALARAGGDVSSLGKQHKGSRASYGVTIWSDKTLREFKARTGNLQPTPSGERDRSRQKRESWKDMHDQFLARNADIWSNERDPTSGKLYDPTNLPRSWDWRVKGGLSKVWEQGACGGCWAFTTAAAVEGVHYIWTREAVTLSPQMLLECDPIDQDCVGGNMVTGYQYAVMKGGISAAIDYPVHPYTVESSRVGPCRSNTARKHAASIDDYIVLENTWDDLKSAIYMQPVSVAVNALSDQFRFYSGGILTYDDCQPAWEYMPNLINHAVVAVGFGYDDDTGLEFIVIKNSWGPLWGENGYARIAIQGTELNATCGLLIEAVAPLKLSNLTYADPEYDPSFNDYVEWAPQAPMDPVNGAMYIILTIITAIAALSMGVLTVVSCMSEDDGYYYTDLSYDEYDSKFDIHHAKRMVGDSDSRYIAQRMRFQSSNEPITGLSTQSRGVRQPPSMKDVKPHKSTHDY